MSCRLGQTISSRTAATEGSGAPVMQRHIGSMTSMVRGKTRFLRTKTCSEKSFISSVMQSQSGGDCAERIRGARLL